MDSITQITLGAALGESFQGKKAGVKAAAWGAFLGTFPDLDILATPFIDNVAEISFHRSITHSILFCLLASPFFGWIIQTIHKKNNVGWWAWTKLSFWVFLTHIFIDLLTTYGTQILYPFTNHPFTFDSIFIIDPLYTFPLLFGLIIALFLKRGTRKRQIINRAGLSISTLYLVWSLGIKTHVHTVFKKSFNHHYGYSNQIKTTPNGPSTFLWNGYVIKEDTIYHSVYSIFDDTSITSFRAIPKNSHLITPYANDRAVSTLLWFSRGFYTVEQEQDTFMFYDLRFGRSDLWLTNETAEYVWQNEILINNEGRADDLILSTPTFNTRSTVFNRFWKRLWGNP